MWTVSCTTAANVALPLGSAEAARWSHILEYVVKMLGPRSVEPLASSVAEARCDGKIGRRAMAHPQYYACSAHENQQSLHWCPWVGEVPKRETSCREEC